MSPASSCKIGSLSLVLLGGADTNAAPSSTRRYYRSGHPRKLPPVDSTRVAHQVFNLDRLWPGDDPGGKSATSRRSRRQWWDNWRDRLPVAAAAGTARRGEGRLARSA